MSIPRDDDNPFAPPRAAVLEAQPAEGEYVPDGQKVAASHGTRWISEGWTLFKASPGTWVGLFFVFAVLSIVLAVIPMGSLVSSLCYAAIVAGIMLGCRSLEQGGPLHIGHLFAGFNKNTGSLLLVGVLYLVGMMLIGLIAGVAVAVLLPFAMGPKFAFDDFSSLMTLAPWLLLVVLVVLALMMPLIMALWFAPALVVFHDVQPMAAMRSSFQGCLRNFMPFLTYGVVFLLLGILAAIPFGLGFLILMPVMWGSMYAAYRDIYVRPA
jgi:uncharacterized membrane protein